MGLLHYSGELGPAYATIAVALRCHRGPPVSTTSLHSHKPLSRVKVLLKPLPKARVGFNCPAAARSRSRPCHVE